MYRVVTMLAVIVLLPLAGCSAGRDAVRMAGEPLRNDVFRVVAAEQAVPGQALLRVEFSVKAYKARIVNRYVPHSDPPYTALLNIDGQPLVLRDDPSLEDLPGDADVNPEAGTGWRYYFRKTLQLAPGSHRVTVAVPLEGVVAEEVLTFKAGENQLRISPVYNSSMTTNRNRPRFSTGLRGLALQVN